MKIAWQLLSTDSTPNKSDRNNRISVEGSEGPVFDRLRATANVPSGNLFKSSQFWDFIKVQLNPPVPTTHLFR